jgi:hypothetical protein
MPGRLCRRVYVPTEELLCANAAVGARENPDIAAIADILFFAGFFIELCRI